ncbi:MAG TPA: hypothetical protein PK847_02570 [Candidatus Sumerlaeota bacterium]|nr:hypothetical protein [Candidatus Sumerlaeota bacterium]
MRFLPLLIMLLAGADGAIGIALTPGAGAAAAGMFLLTGLLIGGGGRLAGARGAAAVAGPALFLLACAAGIGFSWPRAMRALAVADVGDALTEGAYREFAEDSEILMNIEESQYPEFMVKRNYTDAARPEDVTEKELQQFWIGTVPTLIEMQRTHPSYETWRERQLQVVADSHKLRQPLPKFAAARLSGLALLGALAGLVLSALPALRKPAPPAPETSETP